MVAKIEAQRNIRCVSQTPASCRGRSAATAA